MEPVARPKNVDWCRDELILALDVYFRLAGAVPAPQRDDIRELSALLRAAGFHPSSVHHANFRSPASVVMKLMNFRSIDPGYGGKGLTAGGRLDREVWSEFGSNPKQLANVAVAIRSVLADRDVSPAGQELSDLQSVEAEEGALLTRHHLVRERNSRIVQAKKRAAVDSGGGVSCEVCGFSFGAVYGPLGDGFIECHHRRPLSDLRSRQKTLLGDLVLLCANCHRMVHGQRPWLTVEQLRAAVTAQKAALNTDEFSA